MKTIVVIYGKDKEMDIPLSETLKIYNIFYDDKVIGWKSIWISVYIY